MNRRLFVRDVLMVTVLLALSPALWAQSDYEVSIRGTVHYSGRHAGMVHVAAINRRDVQDRAAENDLPLAAHTTITGPGPYLLTIPGALGGHSYTIVAQMDLDGSGLFSMDSFQQYEPSGEYQGCAWGDCRASRFVPGELLTNLDIDIYLSDIEPSCVLLDTFDADYLSSYWGGMDYYRGCLWICQPDIGDPATVHQVDPNTGTWISSHDLGKGHAASIEWIGDDMWLCCWELASWTVRQYTYNRGAFTPGVWYELPSSTDWDVVHGVHIAWDGTCLWAQEQGDCGHIYKLTLSDGSVVDALDECTFTYNKWLGLSDTADICFSDGYLWAMNDSAATFAKIPPDPNQLPPDTHYTFEFDPNSRILDRGHGEDTASYGGMVKHRDLIYFMEGVKIRNASGDVVERRPRLHKARIAQTDRRDRDLILKLGGQYWFGSLSVDPDTNAPWAKRGSLSIAGNQWQQEWDDHHGHHAFSSAFTTTKQSDGSINIDFEDFPDQTYNVAWNGDTMIHAGSVLAGGGDGIDIFARKATHIDVSDILGDHGLFSYQVNSKWPSDSCQWYDCTFDSDHTLTLAHVNDEGDVEVETMAWTLDGTNAVLTLFVPAGEVQNHQSVFLGQGGVGCAWQILPEEGRSGDLGYAVSVKKTNQIMTMPDIAGTYQVRSFQTGPGAVPYTCGQGTCVVEAVDDVHGVLSMEAYCSDGEPDIRSVACSVGPGNELFLDDESTPDAIISPDKSLILIPAWRSELHPTRTPDDRLGGIFLVRVPHDIPEADGGADGDSFSWARRVASTINEDDELAIGLAIDSADNLYVTGWFDGTNDFGNGVALTNRTGGGQDVFIAKYNSGGVPLWARSGGGDTVEWDAGRGIGVDDAGNVYVTGQFHGDADFDGLPLTGFGNSQFFLAKYDTDGRLQWVRQSTGGETHYGTGLAVDGAGNCYAVGFLDDGPPGIYPTIEFGANISLTNTNDGYGTFLVKYDTEGNARWAQLLESSRACYCTAVALDEDGNVFVGGSFRATLRIQTTQFTNAGEKDGFVAKFNDVGVLQWARQITGAGESSTLGLSAGVAGGVYAVGGFGDTACFSSSICLTNIGRGIPGTGVGDAFVAKYDSLSGGVLWAVQAGGTNLDAFTGVSAHLNGNIYVAGGFDGIGVLPDSFQTVVAAYDTNGIERWMQSSTGTNGALSFSGPLVDAAGNCYVAGWYQGQATFGPNVLESGGVWNYFLAKLAAPLNHELDGDWVQLSSMKTARDQFAGAVIGNEIFVFGGNGPSGSGWLYSGEKYDPLTDTWSDIAENPRDEYLHQSWQWGVEEISGIACNGTFYVFGARGYDELKEAPGDLNYKEVYDPATNTWATLPKKPTAASPAVPIVYDDRIYLFGGSGPREGSSEPIRHTVVESYDPQRDTWEHVTDMPKRLFGMAIAVHNNCAYLIGGYDHDTGEASYEVMAYDFETGNWERNYSALPPSAAWWHSYATQTPVANGRAYLAGGIEGKYPEDWRPSDKFTAFDIESKTWKSGPPLPEPRDFYLAVLSDNTIYVIGGEDESETTKDTVFAFRLPGSL